MPIEMHKPKNGSNNVRMIGHDPQTNTLAVDYHRGGLYHYYGPDANLFSELYESESPGQFLRNRVRNRFHYEKR